MLVVAEIMKTGVRAWMILEEWRRALRKLCVSMVLCKHKSGRRRRSEVETRDRPGNIHSSCNGIHTRKQGEVERLQFCERKCNGSSLRLPSKRCSHHSWGAGSRQRSSPPRSSLRGTVLDFCFWINMMMISDSWVIKLVFTLLSGRRREWVLESR